MSSKRELWAGMAFFAVAAGALVLFRRPFDIIGWAGLAACLAFVVVALITLVKPDIGRANKPPARPMPQLIGDPAIPGSHRTVAEQPIPDAPIADPPSGELRILEATIAALEAVDALKSGEINARSLWWAAWQLDPGRPIGVHEAIGSFAALHGEGYPRIGRLIFVPSHTEYDASLLAEITASVLTSFGQDVQPDDVTVTLPQGGNAGTAEIAFPIEGRTRTVSCEYLPKYPPSDLIPALRRFGRAEDPRDLVCADPGDQTLLYAAIRAGTLTELNRRLPAEEDLFQQV